MALLGPSLGMSKAEAEAAARANAGQRAFRPWTRFDTERSSMRRALSRKALPVLQLSAAKPKGSSAWDASADAGADIEVLDVEVSERGPRMGDDVYDVSVETAA